MHIQISFPSTHTLPTPKIKQTHKNRQTTGREDLAREALRGLQLVQPHPMMWAGLGLLLEERGTKEINFHFFFKFMYV